MLKMIKTRKKLVNVWEKKFIWYPMFFSHNGNEYFVFMDFVEVRHSFNILFELKRELRPCK